MWKALGPGFRDKLRFGTLSATNGHNRFDITVVFPKEAVRDWEEIGEKSAIKKEQWKFLHGVLGNKDRIKLFMVS